MGPSAVSVIYTDASSSHGWGAAWGDRCILGKWSKLELREGINWKEFWVLKTALETWGKHLAADLVLVRMDKSTAVSNAYPGAGRVPNLTQLARSTKELEVSSRCTVVAGRNNSIADAPSRFAIRVCGLGPYSERELRH